MFQLHTRATSIALCCAAMLAQQSPGFAQTQTSAGVDQQKLSEASAPVKVRATEEVNQSSVLSGRISDDVENVTKDTLRDIIKLERFNLNYRLNAAKQGAWKGRRFFAAQEADLISTDAALITGTASHYKHIHTGGGSNNVYANGALLPYAIGNIVGASGDVVELGVNGYHSMESGKNGVGAKQSRDAMIKLIAEIDRKLAERARLIKERPPSDKEIADLQTMEGSVLADLRDLGIAKFEQLHSGAKKTLASQNSFYLLDIGTKTTGCIGAFFGMHAYLQGRGGYVVPCGIMNIISGGEIIVNPVISKMIGDAARDRDLRNMEKHGLPRMKMVCDQIDVDWEHLAKFSKNHQIHDRPELASLIGRLETYEKSHTCIVDEISAAGDAARAGRKTSIQGLATGTVVGGSLVAFGTGVTIAGANYLKDSIRFNSNIGWAYLQLTPAITYAALDNLHGQLKAESAYRKQKREHTLPSDLISKRLHELDQAEKSI